MRSHVNIVGQTAYAAWVKGSATGAASPGLAAFQQNGCASCHTFTPAAATGTIGPDLDKLKSEAAKAHRGSLAQFIQESIVNPSAYLEPGYQNLMPATFKQQIPPDQLTKLVQYLAQNAK
jgi:cytochrome c551/c552